MKKLDDQAKKDVLEELLKMIEDSDGQMAESVTVQAPDKAALAEGLDHAKGIIEDPNSAVMKGERSPAVLDDPHSAVIDGEDEDDEDEIRELEERLASLKSRRR
jgi:hypothetical protein